MKSRDQCWDVGGGAYVQWIMSGFVGKEIAKKPQRIED
jgi:hypothetical protein